MSHRRPTHRPRPWKTILALASVSVVLAPTAARAVGTLDQSQTMFTSAAAGTCGDERLAQTFTSGLTGGIDRVDVHLWRDHSNTSADLHVQIQSVSVDVPSGTVLASGSVPLASIGTTSGSPNFVSVAFDPPAKVFAGQRYAIVVLESGLECTQGYWWDFADGLTYPTGEALSLFGTWIRFGGDNGQDFAFKTYVDTSVPVGFDFQGFFSPVVNPPALNQWTAARPVPMRFSLGGDQGLGVLAGRPQVTPIDCATFAPLGSSWNAGMGPLSYRPDLGQYVFRWKTTSRVGGTCRALTVTFTDGSSHPVFFQFSPRH